MRHLLKHIASALAIAPLLAVLGCDATSSTAPAATEPVLAPSYDYTGKWGKHGTVTLVEGPNWSAEFTTSGVITQNGGRLSLGFHELIVPRGAVDGPTRFTMTARFGAFTVIDLTAVDNRTGALVTEFPIDLQLRMTYWLLPIPRNQLHRLRVVWLKDNSVRGELVPMRTTYRAGDLHVVGWLPHFSQFSMAIE